MGTGQMLAIGLFIFFCEEKSPFFSNRSKALEVQDVLIGGDDKVFSRLK